MIRLTRAGFRRWLAKNRGKIVGFPESHHYCPMCKYLRSEGAKNVYLDIKWRRADGDTYTHSKWQRDFQRLAMRRQRELDGVGLRGREALQVLDEV